MAIKLIVCCLFAVTLGFTLPEDHDGASNDQLIFLQRLPLKENKILIRNSRSPQRTVAVCVEHDSQYGTSANINYNHRLGRNFEAYGGFSRNFKCSENSGHVGLRYSF